MSNRLQSPLPPTAIHLCIDMQNLFAEDTPWRTPWMKRVLPVVEEIAHYRPEQTIFTRFMTPRRPEDLPGRWQPYYEKWRDLTQERIDPLLLHLIPSLAALVPPATVIDKFFYSPFHGTDLLAHLRRRNADTLIITGAETDVCVLSAIFDAMDFGFRIIVAQDALCSSADETHDALLALYQRRFSQQIEVSDTKTILSNWQK